VRHRLRELLHERLRRRRRGGLLHERLRPVPSRCRRCRHLPRLNRPGRGRVARGIRCLTLTKLAARQGSLRPQWGLSAWRRTVGHEVGLEHVGGPSAYRGVRTGR
jgi:hypothetical protein